MFRKSLPWLSTLALVWAIVFFARIDEAQLKMDGMTYSAVAKHIVSSGDWKTLHYTKSAYDTFYIHPPLVLWMQAAVFKVLGVSVPTARLLPGLFALGTAAAIFEWGVLAGGAWLGFISVLILFTSLTYIKYASDFILDGPLAFWLTFGSLCFLRLEGGGKKFLNVFLFGVCVAAAFLSKGMVSLSLPAAALGYLVFAKKTGRARLVGYWVSGLLIAGLLLCPWLFMGGGTNYLREYWRQSVTIRMGAGSFSEHWTPLIALVRTDWPWLPIWLWGVSRWVSRNRLSFFSGPLGMALLHSGIILVGYCLTGHIYEHYFVAFHPFAALLTAYAFAEVRVQTQEKTLRYIRYLAFSLAVLVAILPFPLRAQRKEPIRAAAKAAAARCSKENVTEVLISDTVAERWLALAATLWETPWEATSIHPPFNAAEPGRILIAGTGDSIPPSWQAVAGFDSEPFRILEPAGSGLCH